MVRLNSDNVYSPAVVSETLDDEGHADGGWNPNRKGDPPAGIQHPVRLAQERVGSREVENTKVRAHSVTVQVESEEQILKPGEHLTVARVETTRRFQAMGHLNSHSCAAPSRRRSFRRGTGGPARRPPPARVGTFHNVMLQSKHHPVETALHSPWNQSGNPGVPTLPTTSSTPAPGVPGAHAPSRAMRSISQGARGAQHATASASSLSLVHRGIRRALEERKGCRHFVCLSPPLKSRPTTSAPRAAEAAARYPGPVATSSTLPAVVMPAASSIGFTAWEVTLPNRAWYGFANRCHPSNSKFVNLAWSEVSDVAVEAGASVDARRRDVRRLGVGATWRDDSDSDSDVILWWQGGKFLGKVLLTVQLEGSHLIYPLTSFNYTHYRARASPRLPPHTDKYVRINCGTHADCTGAAGSTPARCVSPTTPRPLSTSHHFQNICSKTMKTPHTPSSFTTQAEATGSMSARWRGRRTAMAGPRTAREEPTTRTARPCETATATDCTVRPKQEKCKKHFWQTCACVCSPPPHVYSS
jgi:hypothetical protein